jgi:hypothetical protein
VNSTIGRVGDSDTETAACLPDKDGFVERDRVRVHSEAYGDRGPAILLLPTWSVLAQGFTTSRHVRNVEAGRANLTLAQLAAIVDG